MTGGGAGYRQRSSAAGLLLAGVLFLGGCDGPPSALEPAGRGAAQIAALFWWLAGGAVVVWLAVAALTVYAVRVRPGLDARRAARLIIGGGVVVPVVVLGAYLTFGLAMLPGLLAPAPPGSLTITVSGEQWWWRVRYDAPGGGTVELANELRLPVGEPVELRLESPDVIHAFWVPALGGKVDMIPGRRTRLRLEPTQTGVFRGVCAEYCGSAHALMSFYAVVVERAAFDQWLAQQSAPARAPTSPQARRGRDVFVASGCGACHAVRGTGADGVIGPDLTHVGSRVSLGAGVLPNDAAAFVRWIARTEAVKPGVHMPAFGMLAQPDLQALAEYLDGLE